MQKKILFTLSLLSLIVASASAQVTPDFKQAGDEAVQVLQDLIRLNTTNPPGNETLVAEYVKDLLATEGIAGEIYAKDPTRGNLIARLPGNGTKEPLLILAHSDVVGVEEESWTVDPFAAEILDDGYLYGRGAKDDKAMIAAAVQIMLMVKRSGLTLDRDVILLVEGGEEGTTEWGIDYIVENHLDKIRAEFALNEGGGIHLQDDGSVDRVRIATAEKVPWRGIRLVTRGEAGHGSRPRPDNPVVRLAKAIVKLDEQQMPMRLNETTREYFRRMAEISSPEDAFRFRNIEDPVLGPMIEEYFRQNDLFSNSYIRTSISPNIIEAGFRYNVIPTVAELTLDVRALPDEDMDEFLFALRDLIGDPEVEVMPPTSWRPSGPPSPLGTDLFIALEKAQQRVFPDATTIPVMLTGATDSAQLRAAGIPSYGIGIPATDADDRSHGNDERASITGLHQFVEYMYWTLVEVAGGPR